MGIGITFLLHCVLLFAISAVFAILCVAITAFWGKKDKRKRRLFLAFISPFVGFYTLYICALFGSIVISEIKNVDIGIGDSWYLPLGEGVSLSFIDALEEPAFLSKSGMDIISEVTQIQQTENLLLGKTSDDKYFAYEMTKNKLKIFLTNSEFNTENSNITLNLQNGADFYITKRNELLGIWPMVLSLFSITLAVFSLIFLRVIMLGKRKSEAAIIS